MATVNVYVADDLKARLEGSGLNLSAIAQRCWKRELDLAQLETGEQRVELSPTQELRFRGTQLAESSENEAELYLTEKNMLVWIWTDKDGTTRYEKEPRGKLDPDTLWDFFGGDAEAVDEVASTLGVKIVTYL